MSSTFEPKISIPTPVYTATKAVAATITTVSGVVALFATSISDGSLTWSEGSTLIGAVITSVATIAAVWNFKNEVKNDA